MKPQTKFGSLTETLISIAIGFAVSLVLTAWLLPLYGHAVTLSENLQITAVFTVASVLRGYCVRRWFNWRAGRV